MSTLFKNKYKGWLAKSQCAEAGLMWQEFAIVYALVQARNELGLTQNDVAQRMGISQPAVARIEVGRNVTVNTLVRYARALGRSVHVVVGPAWQPEQRDGTIL